MHKLKLTVDEQITYMRDVKGIKFNITTEEEARVFLLENSYYFKIKAYAKNYQQYVKGAKLGKYVDLEFAYLQELSTIDMYLRKFTIRIALDIEHYLRTQLLRDFADNHDEDGYEIVKKYFLEYPHVKNNIIKKYTNAYCGELVKKHQDNFALWNVVELLSFGDFTLLYDLYYRNNTAMRKMKSGIFSVRMLRNAAAHNNCLINRLRKPYSKKIEINRVVNTFISKIKDIDSTQRKNKLSNPFIHDFVVMLFVFDRIVSSDQIRVNGFRELKDLIDNRFTRNKQYFYKNEALTTAYEFVKKIVDYFNKDSVYFRC